MKLTLTVLLSGWTILKYCCVRCLLVLKGFSYICKIFFGFDKTSLSSSRPHVSRDVPISRAIVTLLQSTAVRVQGLQNSSRPRISGKLCRGVAGKKTAVGRPARHAADISGRHARVCKHVWTHSYARTRQLISADISPQLVQSPAAATPHGPDCDNS